MLSLETSRGITQTPEEHHLKMGACDSMDAQCLHVDGLTSPPPAAITDLKESSPWCIPSVLTGQRHGEVPAALLSIM